MTLINDYDAAALVGFADSDQARCEACAQRIGWDGLVWVDVTGGDVCGVASIEHGEDVPHEAPEPGQEGPTVNIDTLYASASTPQDPAYLDLSQDERQAQELEHLERLSESIDRAVAYVAREYGVNLEGPVNGVALQDHLRAAAAYAIGWYRTG